MKIKNNTHYFSYQNKVFNIVPDTDSWLFQSSKRMSYGQRLYWEYKYIKSCAGQAFFYTFTYNDKSMPYYSYEYYDYDKKENKIRRFPCFNYDHIRLLTNGIISKTLRRKYGSQLRYFVACERGEGKGFRGKGKNPHYHVIFFISPLSDKVRKPSDPPYKRISPIQFCHLCKCVWQYQSTPNKYDHLVADYKSARFGHCQPGDNLGLITDFDALSYVSKYVVKDTLQTSDDKAVKNHFFNFFTQKGITYHALYNYYVYLRTLGRIDSRAEFLEWSCLDSYFHWRCCYKLRTFNWYDYCMQYDYEDFKEFFKEFEDYYKRIYLPEVIDSSYRQYINHYGSKVRTSKSLGIYGLEFVKSPDTNPHFVLDHSDEVTAQPICLYYFRKLYMDVVKCPHSGNPLYVLNEKGISLKCLFLKSSLEKLERDVFASLDSVFQNSNNSEYLSRLYCSNLSLDQAKSLCLLTDLSKIVKRFCVYRFVYEYRHFDIFGPDPAILSGYTFDNILTDYRNFLHSNIYTCDYTELCLLKYIEVRNTYGSVLSFDNVNCFRPYLDSFKLLESFLQVFKDYQSDIKKHDFDSSTVLRQRLNAVKYSHIS